MPDSRVTSYINHKLLLAEISTTSTNVTMLRASLQDIGCLSAIRGCRNTHTSVNTRLHLLILWMGMNKEGWGANSSYKILPWLQQWDLQFWCPWSFGGGGLHNKEFNGFCVFRLMWDCPTFPLGWALHCHAALRSWGTLWGSLMVLWPLLIMWRLLGPALLCQLGLIRKEEFAPSPPDLLLIDLLPYSG